MPAHPRGAVPSPPPPALLSGFRLSWGGGVLLTVRREGSGAHPGLARAGGLGTVLEGTFPEDQVARCPGLGGTGWDRADRWSVPDSTSVTHGTELNTMWVLMFLVLFFFSLSCLSLSPTS